MSWESRPTRANGRAVYLGVVEQVIGCNRNREVREMQRAETVLNIICERGQQGLPLEKAYRLLFNPDLYLRAASCLETQGQ